MTTTALAPTLADVRDASRARRRAEVDEIIAVVAWLENHLVDPRSSDDVAMPDYGDGELLLAGDGAPAVSEAAVVELLCTLGKSDSAGRTFVGKCLELKYRLPRLWQRVVELEVEPWRAFRVAESCFLLPLDGAAQVDAALAPFAHSLSWAQLERTVTAALTEFDPERAERIAGRDPRRLDIHPPPTATSTSKDSSTSPTPATSTPRSPPPRPSSPTSAARSRSTSATSTANLAPLCRAHHRMKTHSGWTYEPAATTEHGVPTAFTWTSPSGDRFRVDRHGSTPLPDP